MLNTKDLIDQLSKYPDNTEWESLTGRCIASELGVIDMEPMVGNDLSEQYCNPSDSIKVNHEGYLYTFGESTIEIERLGLNAEFPFNQEPKLNITEIVEDGKQKMMAAVNCVIAKHENELKVIDNRIKLEIKIAQDSIGRYGNCNESRHLLRNAAIIRSEQYLDSLLGGYGQRQLTATGQRQCINQLDRIYGRI